MSPRGSVSMQINDKNFGDAARIKCGAGHTYLRWQLRFKEEIIMTVWPATCGLLSRSLASIGLIILSLGSFSAHAGCSSADDAISTDRPSTANPATTIPSGSIQIENGMTGSHSQGVSIFDLPESRVRVGLTECTEFLLDLPD